MSDTTSQRVPTRVRWFSTVLLCALGMQTAIAEPDVPQATHRPMVTHQVDAATRQVSLSDAALRLEYPDWLVTVRSSTPEIIHVRAIRPDCLQVERRSAGTATLTAIDRRNRQYTLEVMVDSGAGSQ